MLDPEEAGAIIRNQLAKMTPEERRAAVQEVAPELLDPSLPRRPTPILDFLRSLSEPYRPPRAGEPAEPPSA